MIDSPIASLRQSLGRIFGQRGFAIAVVLTLALGVGATSAIFSVVNGVILKPLPYPEPEQVVRLGWQWSAGGGLSALSGIKFEHAREQARSLSALAISYPQSVHLESSDGRTLAGRGQRVSQDWLEVLGYSPALGRDFDPAMDRPGGDRVVAISQRVWAELFAADPAAIGQELWLDGEAHRVIAVLPSDYRFVDAPEWTDFLVPMQLQADPRDASHNFVAIGRLADGVGLEQARAELDALATSLAQRYPEAAQRGDLDGGYRLADYREVLVGSSLRRNLWLLMGAVGFVLLIVTSNIASLFLSRMARRRPEIALRSALGAGRGRLLTQLLTESTVLGLLGGALGLLLGVWLVGVLVAVGPELPRADAIGLDWRVLAFSLGIGVASALTASLGSAWAAARTPPFACLREAGHSGGSPTAGRFRGLLLTLQATLATVLLAGALTMISTFQELRGVDLGLSTESVLAVDFGRLPAHYAQPAAAHAFRAEVLERVSALPGVRSAGLAYTLPFEQGLNIPVTLADDFEAGESAVEWRAVGGDYFQALGIEQVAGRLISAADRADSAPVVVVSESFARQYYGAESPLGRRLNIGYIGAEPALPGWEAQESTREIVGVVADVRDIHPGQAPRRTLYVPLEQVPPMLTEMMPTLGGLLVEVGSRPERQLTLLRDTVQQIDPALEEIQVRMLAELGGQALGANRFNAVLMGGFAGLALVLVAVGLYGVLSFLIAQRTREIGLRLALGALPRRLIAQFMARGLGWVILGAGIGLLVALALAEAFATLGLGLEVIRGDALALALITLAAASLLAAWLPTRRAASIQPMEALRHD